MFQSKESTKFYLLKLTLSQALAPIELAVADMNITILVLPQISLVTYLFDSLCSAHVVL